MIFADSVVTLSGDGGTRNRHKTLTIVLTGVLVLCAFAGTTLGATGAVEGDASETDADAIFIQDGGENETDQNGTVTQVNLATDDNNNLTYEVQIGQGDDQQVTVIIDAFRDGEGVINVEGADGGGETQTGTETETETETEQGGGMDEGNETGDGGNESA